MRALLAALVAAMAAALPLACGGDDEPGRTVTVQAEAVEAIEVVGDEYSFDPENVIVEGSGGAPRELRLTLKNEGDLAHDLKVFDGDDEIGGTQAFDEGSRTATVTLEPGEYRLVCTVADHEDQGMTGRLTLR